MTNKRKAGRPMGAAKFTGPELDFIRLGLSQECSVVDIAAMIGRGRSAVYAAISRMRQRGTLGQEVLDLGQIEGASHDHAR